MLILPLSEQFYRTFYRTKHDKIEPYRFGKRNFELEVSYGKTLHIIRSQKKAGQLKLLQGN